MKTLFRALAPFAFMAAVSATPAAAADLYTKAPAYAATPFNVYNWNGFYVGANIGYESSTVTNWPSSGPKGVAGGGQVGYNWQVTPNWVLGLETDIQASSANDTFAGFQFSNPWFGTVRGRVGYAYNNFLIYGTGGFAYGGGSVTVGSISNSQTHTGWTLGGGVEVGLTPNWSAKAEYLYVRLEDESYVLTGLNNGFESNVFRLGVNYRF
ncbi:MAG TPA: outer membrane protein [Xanthobacteraceae bacterium]|nr:outer membrane protein [Xanthobacteraceae bacterium]